jgi:hypothetical protein
VPLVVAALGAALNAALWTQAYPLLARPVWVWNPSFGAPDRDGIAPVQTHPWIFAAAAAVAAASWGLIAERTLRARIIGRRYQPVVPAARLTTPSIGGAAGMALKAGFVVLLLGGLVPTYGHAILAFTILFAAFLAQRFVLPRTAAARWWTTRLPLVFRLAIAAAVAWLVAWQISRAAYESVFGTTVITARSFAPLLYASVAAIAVMTVLMPVGGPPRQSGDTVARGASSPGQGTATEPRRPRPPAPPSAFGVVGLLAFTGGHAALADNCGSLSDCLPSARGLLIALAAVLIVVGIAALLAGTGGMAAGPLAALLEGGGLAFAAEGVAGSAGAISATAAADLAAAGAVSTVGGIMLAEAASGSGSSSGSSSGSGSGSGAGGNVDRFPKDDFEGTGYSADDLAGMTYRHTGSGDMHIGGSSPRPTEAEITQALRNGLAQDYEDHNAVQYVLGRVKVIINRDMPWQSTAYYIGG